MIRDEQGMWYVLQEKEMYTTFLMVSLKRRGHLGDVGLDRKIIIKWVLREIDCEDMNCIHLVQNRVQW